MKRKKKNKKQEIDFFFYIKRYTPPQMISLFGGANRKR